jgi:uncharacterized membrane protein YgcG
MKSLKLLAVAALMGTTAVVPIGAPAQEPPGQTAPAAVPAGPALTEAQLDQLAAPVALYDDPLLVDILTASTYPVEVVEAHRWVSDPQNAGLKGDALTTALSEHDWDASVKALVPFANVLQTMDSHLDWTESLGEAFLAQQGDVMDAVQRLRHRAESAGTLKSSSQEAVANDGDDVTISSPPSDVIYVPDYNPWCAYGAWPYPIEGPYYFAPWNGVCGPDDDVLGWDAGIFLPFAYWGWGGFDWHHHHIWIDHGHYGQYNPAHGQAGDVWHHDPGHRASVPYRDPRNTQQFQPAQDRQSFRGYDRGDSEPFESSRPRPSAFGDFGSGSEVRSQSERGQSSRGFGGGRGGFGGGGHGGGGHR